MQNIFVFSNQILSLNVFHLNYLMKSKKLISEKTDITTSIFITLDQFTIRSKQFDLKNGFKSSLGYALNHYISITIQNLLKIVHTQPFY